MRKINQNTNPSLLDKNVIGLGNIPNQSDMSAHGIERTTENENLLLQAERYFSDMRDIIGRRKRVRDFIRGYQWSDPIYDDDLGLTTEEEYIKSQGIVPLKQNLMRNIMKNLSGQYQSNPSKSIILSNKNKTAKVGEMLTNTLYYAHQINDGQYMNARQFDEFMLSGMPVAKILYQYIPDLERPDIEINKVDNRRFGFNTDITDPRMNDIYFTYELIDAPIEIIISKFAKSKKQEALIRELYTGANTLNQHNLESLKPDAVDFLDFYVPYEPSKCRVIEIWYQENVWGILSHDPLDPSGGYSFDTDITMEDIDLENANRKLIGIANGIAEEDIALIEANEHNTNIWKYKFLTPTGYCLLEGETPYEHGEHPYVIFGYPMIDGQIWGPLEDILDQQKNLNRYVTQLDVMNSSAAKGVWLLPEEAKPDDMSKEDYQEALKGSKSAVWYKANSTQNPTGAKPEQKFSNATPQGLIQILQMQMQYMQDISGVQASLQGQRAATGTPAALYAQEAQNAATSLIDYMNAFGMFVKKVDTKIIKTVIQFYKEPRLIHVAGTDYEREAMEFDPSLVDGFDFDLVVTPGTSSAVYKQVMDDILFRLLDSQQINIEMFLQNTSLPFAAKLLESIQSQKQALMQGQQIPAPDQALVQELQAMSGQGQ